MNCLQNLPRSSTLPSQAFTRVARKPSRPSIVFLMDKLNTSNLHQRSSLNATSGPPSSTEMSGSGVDEVKSDVYSNNMTQAMGAVLTYRHELGMNYNFIRPDIIVGSCLQSPEDVDKLRKIGVKTIFCLQQDSDLEYFSVDVTAIQQYAKQFDDIQHLRARIRDFDAFDLRLRLPAVVSKLFKAINRNGGVTYIHCTAGLGRAPAVALAYMFWVQGYKLSEAHSLLLIEDAAVIYLEDRDKNKNEERKQKKTEELKLGKQSAAESIRPCFPKLDAIKSATADILTGLTKKRVTLTWEDNNCSSVEISGLDIGWGQRIPLKFNEKGQWILEKELPEGHYEYKYIIDGEWTCNKSDPVTLPNKDGHVNNYIDVSSLDPNSSRAELQKRLSGDDVNLSQKERFNIREFLEAYADEEEY